MPRPYVGRFAPSPSGDLHSGSLYAAAASYLDARAHGGRWLIRLEDLDAPRVVPGSARRILDTLQHYGFEWDGEIARQSARTDRYRSALDSLQRRNQVFECSCSRSQRKDEARYPGHCRLRPLHAGVATATRLRIDSALIRFTDRIQGMFRQDVAAAVGDIVIRRRDGPFAYVLAVVVDDAEQGVTDVVRGADLLDNTPQQIYLQGQLGMATPRYAHVPVLTEAGGRKLAKSRRSAAVSPKPVIPVLIQVFDLLGLEPASELSDAAPYELWAWAIARWHTDRVPKRLSLPVTG